MAVKAITPIETQILTSTLGHLVKIIGLKFRKMLILNEKAFSVSFKLAISLVDQRLLDDATPGTRRQQNGNRFVQIEWEIRSDRLEQKRWITSEGRPFVAKILHLIRALLSFAFAVETKISAYWKATTTTTKFISIPIYIHGIAYYTNRFKKKFKKTPLE